MKILALLNSYHSSNHSEKIGGGEISNRLLLEYLASQGHQVTVVTLASDKAGGQTPNEVNVVKVNFSFKNKFIAQIFKRVFYHLVAKKEFDLTSPDVVLGATNTVPVALRLVGKSKVPVAIFIRAFENFQDSSKINDLRTLKHLFFVTADRILLGDSGPKALENANLLIVNSKFMSIFCKEKVPRARIEIVYPPLTFAVTKTSDSTTPRTVSMVGTSIKKGTNLFLRISKRFPNLKFRIIGDPSVSKGSPIRDGNVVRTGWTDAVTEFKDHTDIVLVPSVWNEPFGRVAIEALAAGKIPLVSNRGGLPEAVGYESALIVPTDEEDNWASRLNDVIDNFSKYQSIAKKIQIANYSVEKQGKALEKCLIDVVSPCQK